MWDVCTLPWAPSPGTAYVTRGFVQDLSATLEDYSTGNYSNGTLGGQSCGTGGNESSTNQTRRQIFQEVMERVLHLTGAAAHGRRNHDPDNELTEGYVTCEQVSPADASCYDGNSDNNDGCSDEVHVSRLGVRLGEV